MGDMMMDVFLENVSGSQSEDLQFDTALQIDCSVSVSAAHVTLELWSHQRNLASAHPTMANFSTSSGNTRNSFSLAMLRHQSGYYTLFTATLYQQHLSSLRFICFISSQWGGVIRCHTRCFSRLGQPEAPRLQESWYLLLHYIGNQIWDKICLNNCTYSEIDFDIRREWIGSSDLYFLALKFVERSAK